MIWDRALYQWPKGKSSAVCLSVDVDAYAPWLWQHRASLPDTLAIHEHRQYGLRAGLSRMVGMLDRLGISGSFFVPAVVAQENPSLLPGLIERGHEVALHGFFHELVAEASDEAFTDALEASVELFLEQTGQRPQGFRSPAWEMTPHMLKELKRLALWDSSLMGEDVPYSIDGVVELPVRWDNDDAIFFKFLGAEDKSPRPDAEVEQQWAGDAGAQRRDGGLFMLTVHDWISGRAARVEMLERILRSQLEHESVWCATCGQIAAHHKTLADTLEIVTSATSPVNIRAMKDE